MNQEHDKPRQDEQTQNFIRYYNELKAAGRFANNAELLPALGYKRESSITEILKGRQNIPTYKYISFLSHFGITDVNTENTDNVLRESKENYITKRREQKNLDEPFMVPFIDIPAQAGYTKAYNNIDYIHTLKKYPILPDVDPHGAIWRYFQIEGDSMEPEFRSGDTILCSQVPKDDWTSFGNYLTYVIVTDNELWIKDVYRQSQNEWYLLSQNEHYEPFAINVEDVRQVWIMRRHIKNRAKKHRMYDLEQIKKQLKGK